MTPDNNNHNVDNEADEARGGSEALHGALLPGLPRHLHDVCAHAAPRGSALRVPPLCGLQLRSEQKIHLRVSRRSV